MTRIYTANKEINEFSQLKHSTTNRDISDRNCL